MLDIHIYCSLRLCGVDALLVDLVLLSDQDWRLACDLCQDLGK